jgi:CTP:molybdopterin cytidylyltransferase MocA
MGSAKQLLRDANGEALLVRLVRDAREGGCAPVVVVLGAYAESVRDVLRDALHDKVRDVRPDNAGDAELVVCVENVDWAEGMSGSIRAGLQAIESGTATAVMLLTCDQPSVDVGHIRALLAAHEDHGERVVSQYDGVCGIPAIWPRAEWPLLASLEGDRGARSLLRGDETAVPLSGGAMDLDTPEDVYRWRRTEPRVD